jgi:D-lactate dehydrogenase
MTFKNVLITAHQAFLTETALTNIADTTIDNLNTFEEGTASPNEISV